MGFNLEDYETVEERLAKFWEKFPDGRISTKLISPPESNVFVVFTEIYRTEADSAPYATGLAREVVSDRGIFATSALETCETSSIGRSLANGGFAAKGKRPSRSEMESVVAQSDSPVVKHPFQGVTEKPIPNEPSTIDWDDEAKAFNDESDFINNLKQQLGADPIKYGCTHGDRVFREGTSKSTGKPYAMWSCVAKLKSDQCEPLWGKMVDGRWQFEARAAQ